MDDKKLAGYIREIGRGAKAAGDLSRNDARSLYAAMLGGLVPDLQLGAILLAMRVKGESLDELAGFVAAAEASYNHLPLPPGGTPVVIPSYNGARQLPNLVPLLALLLAREGTPVLIHGITSDPGRVTTHEVLAALGIEPSFSSGEVHKALGTRGIAFMPIQALAPEIAVMLALRSKLGLRNSTHTIVKMLQPFAGTALRIVSVTHPDYLTRMRRVLHDDGYGRAPAPRRGGRSRGASTARAFDRLGVRGSSRVVAGRIEHRARPPARSRAGCDRAVDRSRGRWARARTARDRTSGRVLPACDRRDGKASGRTPVKGKVYLVGAGPGDPELLTLKAVRLLGCANVVLVDDLVNRAILVHIREGARVVRVGKRGGCKSTPQDFIERLMISEAKAGHTVVRLKGGDPFIFGRAGEEIEALIAAGIEYEVVSGITAGLAAASAAGVPLTHRSFTQGVTFVTAHAAEKEPDWRALVQSGMTLVVYMGVTRCAAVQEALLTAGMPAATPVAVIENASLPRERRLTTRVDRLAGDVTAHEISSPAIMVIGEVARPAASLVQPHVLATVDAQA